MNTAAILIIDDDEEDRMILKDSFPPPLLPAVSFFESGDELLAYLSSTAKSSPLPRLVISDLNMPAMDGLQLLKKLKSHPLYKAIDVVILSTAGRKSVKEACLELGALAYFEKPYSGSALKALIREFIKLAKL